MEKWWIWVIFRCDDSLWQCHGSGRCDVCLEKELIHFLRDVVALCEKGYRVHQTSLAAGSAKGSNQESYATFLERCKVHL